jgi:aerotaxis receptor
MRKTKVIPKDIEKEFGIDEIFFSTTDLKGIIQYGNEVFTRISGYEFEELFGAPHNIVRHPDMPKIVFRQLWNYIQSGKPIVAYVKNMSKDGSYYWVVATVFPIFDKNGNQKKYLSIRIKPTSKIFKIIPDLYKKLLEIEKERGVDASYEYLLEILKEKGFKDYDDFMKKALEEEIKSREKIIGEKEVNLYNLRLNSTDPVLQKFERMKIISDRMYAEFNEAFKELEKYIDLKNELQEKAEFISNLAEDIILLSLNASIESYKVKDVGVSFSVLSKEMRENTTLIERNMKKMVKTIDDITKELEDNALNINYVKLQSNTIESFANEIIQSEDSSDAATLKSNLLDLISLMREYLSNINGLLKGLNKSLLKISNEINNLETLIKRLNFIHTNGIIESAHFVDSGQGFVILFSQMSELVNSAKAQIENLSYNLRDRIENSKKINRFVDSSIYDIQKIELILDEIPA